MPRVLTLDHIRDQIWKENRDAWPILRHRLTTDKKIDFATLTDLHDKGFLWAVNGKTLAVKRTGLNENDTARLGVTLLDVTDPILKPRILVPQQGGVFWLSADLAKADIIRAVANPLEAICCRSIYDLDLQASKTAGLPAPPKTQIISLDSDLPTAVLINQIAAVNKQLHPSKQKLFKLSTNSSLDEDVIAKTLPFLLKQDGQPVGWFEIDPASSYIPEEQRSTAWNAVLIEKKQMQQEQARRPER